MSNMRQFQQDRPVCPHCEYKMTHDDMHSCCGDIDLYALAADEDREAVKCPSCDLEYWVAGGYTPHYTTAAAEEDL